MFLFVKLVNVNLFAFILSVKVCLQLPDYHEIIKNPMDFSTLRKKLESGAYANLEQFEASLVIERIIFLDASHSTITWLCNLLLEWSVRLL